MGKRYLIDTNAVIDYLSNKFPDNIKIKMNTIIDEEINLSVINKIELLVFSEQEQALNDFVTYANIFSLTDDIVDLTIEIRRKHKTKIPDAVIAATAICNNFILVTNNSKDFIKIKNLKIVNPYTDL